MKVKLWRNRGSEKGSPDEEEDEEVSDSSRSRRRRIRHPGGKMVLTSGLSQCVLGGGEGGR